MNGICDATMARHAAGEKLQRFRSQAAARRVGDAGRHLGRRVAGGFVLVVRWSRPWLRVHRLEPASSRTA